MSDRLPPFNSFGRRSTLSQPAPVQSEKDFSAPPPTLDDNGFVFDDFSDDVAQIRVLCLSSIDPSTIVNLPPERIRVEIEKAISQIVAANRLQVNQSEQRQLASDLVNDMMGLGPLQVLVDDTRVADIMVNGPDRVFVEIDGKTYRSKVRFRDQAHLSNICQRIASAVGRRVDEASPIVDARLADGSRVNIVFPPLALDGPYVSIRKFSAKAIDLEKLVALGTITPQMAGLISLMGRCRLNIIVSGGTGSGKTTLLNAISRAVIPTERIITIEDAAELQLQQPHVVRLETRPASLEGGGEITQRDLVRNALRMRPDRLIVGEVRSGEAFDMLQAMNTGHDGSMSTVHANSSRDALTRIENMVHMGSINLSANAIRAQIASAVDVIIQIERHRDGKRRVTQISDVGRMEGDVIILNDILTFVIDSESSDEAIKGGYAFSRARPSFWQKLVYFGVAGQWQKIMSESV
ncbi:AAA domain-containing protein [Acetobacteraceae bacterium EV16G]|uniref:AAA domain-containing protein n=1 Tax=Sorlinia euscelidii TaxID=3081148 RepID=A0ABU7U1Z6_9PROT